MNAPSAIGPRFVGKRVVRKEDARLLTGRGQFTDDVVLPGMLHVAFHRSPIARGKILSIDTSAALEVPGVHAVMTAADIARVNVQMIGYFMIEPPIGPKIGPLAIERVAYVGDPVAMVLADSRYIAEDAAALIMVEYEEQEPVLTMAAARSGPPIHPDLESNLASPMQSPPNPDLEAAIKAAPHVVTGTIRHQRICQNPMEARGVVFSKNGEGEITVYMSCQSPHIVARYLSIALRQPEASIRVIAKDVGGGFGLKAQPWREEMAAIAAGMVLGRPVKWVEDRFEHLTTASLCREQELTLTLAFDNDARLIGGHAEYYPNNGAFPHVGSDNNMAACYFMWPAYKIPAFSWSLAGVYTNTIGLGGYRGPWAIESLARETVLDIAARKIGTDPVELRRRNLVTAADQPYTDRAFGHQVDDITPSECLDALLERLDVKAFRVEQAAARKAGRYLGLGVATYIEPTASSTLGLLASDVAQIRVEPTGKVTAVLSTHSQGHGTQTTMAQVIADSLGVPLEDISVFEDDSSRGGFGPGAAGSRQAVTGGGAAIKASELLVDKIKRATAHLLNANPNDVRIENGEVRIAGAPEQTRSLREIAQICYDQPSRLPPDMQAGLEAQYRYSPPPVTWTSAAHGCIVEVDAETGFVEIKRWVCTEDCGLVINPAIVEGQIAGGLAQGIGEVLLEHTHFDEAGNITTSTLKDYLLPCAVDIPDFEYVHLATPSKTPGGFRGVGEGGAIIGPPTLVNAIADALAPFGAECLDLPLTPSKVLKLMTAGAAG